MADLFPDPLARIAGRISGGYGYQEEPEDVRRQFVLRMATTDLFELDFLAAQAGESRNAFAVQLIRSGLRNLWQMLPDEVGQNLTEAYYEAYEREFGVSPDHDSHTD